MLEKTGGRIMEKRLVKISKEISYALRHAPQDYGLVLDAEGFVPVETLLAALAAKHPGRPPITEEDLAAIIATSPKRRFEIQDGRICALYGHSAGMHIEKTAAAPPRILYHGTAHASLPSIMAQGLLPMGREYVHLSVDQKTALQVGGRHDHHPALLQVDCAQASREGITFYQGNETTWLADRIPPDCLELLSQAGPEEEPPCI